MTTRPRLRQRPRAPRDLPDIWLEPETHHGAARHRRWKPRDERRRVARARRTLAVGVVAFAALIGLAFALTHSGSTDASPRRVAEIVAESRDGDSRDQTDPTPLFATFEDVELRLPFEPQVITVLAFHQASGEKAHHLTALVPDTDAAALKDATTAALASTATAVAAAAPNTTTADEEGVWTGSAIRLWRSNRTGAPDTAADVGAIAGSDVYAPVTGTVLQAREYLLYGTHPDWEVHIRPDGHPELDLVVIHIGDVSVQAGDRVSAGITRIASVRDLSPVLDMQLGEYTTNGGIHVHLQMNAVDATGRLDELTES